MAIRRGLADLVRWHFAFSFFFLFFLFYRHCVFFISLLHIQHWNRLSSTLHQIDSNRLHTIHYKCFFVNCLVGFILLFSCWIKSKIFNAGPTFMHNISTISSLVSCSRRTPSTLFRAKVSQWVAQSFTRRNCATSATFHVSGVSSLLSDFGTVDLFEPLSMRQGMYFAHVGAELCEIREWEIRSCGMWSRGGNLR